MLDDFSYPFNLYRNEIFFEWIKVDLVLAFSMLERFYSFCFWVDGGIKRVGEIKKVNVRHSVFAMADHYSSISLLTLPSIFCFRFFFSFSSISISFCALFSSHPQTLACLDSDDVFFHPTHSQMATSKKSKRSIPNKFQYRSFGIAKLRQTDCKPSTLQSHVYR